VRISTDPDAHLLATGIDEAGRRQYRYHPEFRDAADDVKFVRIAALGARIGRVRTVVRDAIGSEDPRERLTGLVARLIDTSLMRVGTERYADEHDTYGASTLRCEHATLTNDVLQLCFTGKSGRERCIEVADADLVGFVADRTRQALPEDLIFATPAGWTVDGTNISDLLCSASRVEVSAKDLRTWGASRTMVDALCVAPAADGGSRANQLTGAYDRVAEALGNTRAVARNSYVAPVVAEAHEHGSLADCWAASRASRHRSRAEGTLDRLLGRAAD